MELSSEEGEIPMPLNSTYGGGGHGHGHMIHHDPTTTPHSHIIIPSNSAPPHIIPSNGPIVHTISSMELDDPASSLPYNNNNNKKLAAARYKECLKNHAATMGGNATDGCGEFMPSGEDGTLEALTCSACNCHRNFHRKEVEGEQPNSSCHDFYHSSSHLNRVGRRVLLGHHKNILGPESLGYHHPTGTIIPSRVAPPHHQMIMSYNMGGSLPSESDEQEDGGVGGMVLARPPHHQQLLKKRFRTKFTQEQKEKMMNFAEKVGWKIQKQEESVVQQFCQEIGVKRRVLKVWMHNNKHNLAKNNPSSSA